MYLFVVVDRVGLDPSELRPMFAASRFSTDQRIVVKTDLGATRLQHRPRVGFASHHGAFGSANHLSMTSCHLLSTDKRFHAAGAAADNSAYKEGSERMAFMVRARSAAS